LISRPMQISTRVGVVHAIGRPLAFPDEHRVDRDRPPRKHLRKAHAREHKLLRSAAQRENRTLAGPVCSSSARGPTITFQRGTADGATIAIWEDGQPSAASGHSMPRRFSHTTQRLACQPCGYREARWRRCFCCCPAS
jgi:hypothetical protein